MKVSFVNEGLIDLTAITTFGVSAKETSDPFGYFGTGFKYAIAILLRENQKITMFRGLDKYEFTSVERLIRNKSFQLIQMNGTDLGFTTDLGKNWPLWQAFRELYCNAMDENGDVSDVKITPMENRTIITITGGDFHVCYLARHDIILSTRPKYTSDRMNIHERPGEHLFYKTIRIADMSKEAYFTYDIKRSVNLTEDRTLKYDWEFMGLLRDELVNGKNSEFISKFATVPRGMYESEFRIDMNTTPNEVFMTAMSKLNFKDVTNTSLMLLYNNQLKIKKSPNVVTLTNIEQIQLDKAIKFGKDLFDYDFTQYEIYISDDLRDNILGMVYDKKIYLSRRVFQQGTKQVTATLLEEYLHLHRNYIDETYEFQTFLFDLVVGLGEQLKGEPL